MKEYFPYMAIYGRGMAGKCSARVTRYLRYAGAWRSTVRWVVRARVTWTPCVARLCTSSLFSSVAFSSASWADVLLHWFASSLDSEIKHSSKLHSFRSWVTPLSCCRRRSDSLALYPSYFVASYKLTTRTTTFLRNHSSAHDRSTPTFIPSNPYAPPPQIVTELRAPSPR